MGLDDPWAPIGLPQLRAAHPDDGYLRWGTAPAGLAVAGPHGWACLSPWRPAGHWGGIAVTSPGAPEGAASAALAVLVGGLADGVAPEWFSTPPEGELEPPPGYRFGGTGRWTFMWTTQPVIQGGAQPSHPQPSEQLDDADDAAEIEAFGRAHNPDFEGFPGRGLATLWLGRRDASGALVAAGGLHTLANGAPHLAGLVVDRAQRGRGLGLALAAELTARALAEGGLCTLSVYTDNVGAIRLYERLGYRRGRDFETRTVLPEGVDA